MEKIKKPLSLLFAIVLTASIFINVSAQDVRGGRHRLVDMPAVVSQTLGITADEARELLRGEKLGETLIKENKLDAFKKAFLENLRAKLDAAVKSGEMTKDDADKILQAKTKKIEAYDGKTPLFKKPCKKCNPEKDD